MNGLAAGIMILGMNLVSKQAVSATGIIICNNQVSNSDYGIIAAGLVGDVQISGNRLWSSALGPLYFMQLAKGSANVCVVNNTVKNVQKCVVVDRPYGGLPGIEFRNNLVLADRGPDVAIVNTGSRQRFIDSWRIEQTWRLLASPPDEDSEWIPAAKDRVGPVELMSYDDTNANYLRPAKDTPLANEGVGSGDPALPAFIGAVPPEETADWDWQKTWKLRVDKASASTDP